MSYASQEDLVNWTQSNSSFSKKVPGLQLAIDQTSLGAFKTCPRFYFYSIVRGLAPKSLSHHLVFGLHLHKGRELYEVAKAQGQDHEAALRAVVRATLVATWDRELSRGWQSQSPEKNRLSLIRSLVWYLDQFGKDDPLETLIMENGEPAVEVSVSIDSGHQTLSSSEAIILCGHLDRLVKFADQIWISDIKTSGKPIDQSWFAQFSPDLQFSFYPYIGQAILAQPIGGLIVDGLQIGASFTRFGRGPIARSASQLEEFGASLPLWFRMMEMSALARSWPQNEKSCSNYGGCQFRDVCRRPPAAREAFIQANFTTRVWDPIQRRGVAKPPQEKDQQHASA